MPRSVALGQKAGTAWRSCAGRPEKDIGVGSGGGYGEVRRVLRERVGVR
ncbi:hypothetical protein [Streptomyces sp. NPDC057694]